MTSIDSRIDRGNFLLLSRGTRFALLAGLAGIVMTGPLEAQRKRVLEPIAAKLEPTRKLVYKTVGERALQLHIFEPEGHHPTDKRPVFLCIHGGGWTGGGPRKFYPMADRFRKLGMIGISIEYRLLNKRAGTTVFDCVADGRSAVRYLRRHADELGIHPQKIVVSGGSAGGHVAAGTALFDDSDEPGENTGLSCRPDALVLYNPVINTSAEGYGQQKIGENWRKLSPVHHVPPGMPPTILFHGTGDTVVPYAGAVEFQQKMKQMKNDCELVTHPGGIHGYFIFDLELFESVMQRTEEFVRKQAMLK